LSGRLREVCEKSAELRQEPMVRRCPIVIDGGYQSNVWSRPKVAKLRIANQQPWMLGARSSPFRRPAFYHQRFQGLVGLSPHNAPVANREGGHGRDTEVPAPLPVCIDRGSEPS
jgi:hypothetical protein